QHRAAASVADEQQRHADHRQDAQNHSDVDEGMPEEESRGAERQISAESIARIGRDIESAEDEEEKDERQRRRADETVLLRPACEREVRVPFRNELQLVLCSAAPALSPQLAA